MSMEGMGSGKKGGEHVDKASTEHDTGFMQRGMKKIVHGISVATGHEARVFENAHTHESNGVVTEMEVQQRPPIMTMIGKTMAMIPQSALFIVHLEVDGHVGQIIMTKENYDEFSVGTAIHVTYAEQESSTKINVKGLTSA